jgi:hypothetical protein
MTTIVTCAKCNAPREVALIRGSAPYPPCANCGSQELNAAIWAEDTATCTESIALDVTPDSQARNWRQRWEVIQSDLRRLQASRVEMPSSECIIQGRHELHSFYVQAYHLKDALIQDAAAIGVTKATIEAAMTSNPNLALLADLANLDKHGALTRPPRSGTVPVIKTVSGKFSPGMPWRLNVEIQHGAITVDGLDFAARAVAALGSLLHSWGLV